MKELTGAFVYAALFHSVFAEVVKASGEEDANIWNIIFITVIILLSLLVLIPKLAAALIDEAVGASNDAYALGLLLWDLLAATAAIWMIDYSLMLEHHPVLGETWRMQNWVWVWVVCLVELVWSWVRGVMEAGQVGTKNRKSEATFGIRELWSIATAGVFSLIAWCMRWCEAPRPKLYKGLELLVLVVLLLGMIVCTKAVFEKVNLALKHGGSGGPPKRRH